LRTSVSFRVYRSDLLETSALPLNVSSSLGIRYPFRVLSRLHVPGLLVPESRFAVGPAPGLAVFREDDAESIQNTLKRASRRISRSCRVFRSSSWLAFSPWRAKALTTLMDFRTLQHILVTGIRA
jgi:hypothetical protein